uniref:Transposase (Putative), gypsy type n=1 Tax=Tanacetum cinerariifolium TaxID=118510 RepID=A0A6L2JS78_TANCI|nr:transposase (putative), gypsy type [Tanacetum cinerariifolium]
MLESIDSGANNDISVLDNTPLFNDLLDGIAIVALFVVNGVGFEKGYYQADGIYPQWETFVKSFLVANGEKHAFFKSWDEICNVRGSKDAKSNFERSKDYGTKKRILVFSETLWSIFGKNIKMKKNNLSRRGYKICDWVWDGLRSLVGLDLQAPFRLDLVLKEVTEMISCTNESKPLALPQGSAVIVIADVDYFPRAYLTVITSAFFESYLLAVLVDYTCPHLVAPCIYYAKDAPCEKFHIPPTVHPELPGHNSRIRNSPTGKIGVYTRPLDSLKYYNDHFFWVDASVFPLAVPWHNNKTLRKDPHPTPDELDANGCDYLADNPAPFRKLPEPFLCFVGISRYYDLDENCYPTFWAEMDLFAFINHAYPTKVRIGEREVGEREVPLLQLTRGGGDAAVADQVEEIGHAIQGEGVNIVCTEGEIQAIVAEKPKVQKRMRTSNGASGSNHPPKKLRKDHNTSGHAGASTGGKPFVAIQELSEQSTLNIEVGVTATATVPFVTSSVTPTPERGDGGPTDSVSAANLQTKRPSERIVISSDTPNDSSANAADDEVYIIVRAGPKPVHHTLFVDSTSVGEADPDVVGPSYPTDTELSTDSFYVSQDLDSETLHLAYVPKWNVTNDSALDDPGVCRSMIDHLAPPMLLSQLRGMDYDQLFVEFNVGAARQTCLSSKKERDAEIASLKARLSLEEVTAAEAIHLRGQVVVVEAVTAARVNELNGLKEQNVVLEGQELTNLQLSCDGLSIKAAFLESEKDKLIDQVSTLEVKALIDKVVRLDADLMGMALHLDDEFYPRYSTTVVGRRWILSHGLKIVVMKCLQSPEYLAALGWVIGRAIKKGMQGGLSIGIEHGKVERGLADVAAYNPSMEADYISAVNALYAVDFPLLAQLESHKDTSMAKIMGLLRLEGPATETLEASQLQPSPEQFMLPIHRLEDQVVIGETSLSFSLDLAHARIQRLRGNDVSRQLIYDALASIVHSAVVADDRVLGAGPSTRVPSPPQIVFEQEELETTSEYTTAS